MSRSKLYFYLVILMLISVITFVAQLESPRGEHRRKACDGTRIRQKSRGIREEKPNRGSNRNLRTNCHSRYLKTLNLVRNSQHSTPA